MPSSVKSAEHCLRVLEFLNVKNGATQRDVCVATGLSRGSAYRSLETLRHQGYLRKDRGSVHYWLAARVRALAMGYQDESWIVNHVAPIVTKFGHKIKWPVKFLTLDQCDLVNRVTTDYESPFTENKYPTGWRVSLLWSAAGHAYLAFCDPATRAILLKMVVEHASPSTELRKRTMKTPALNRIIQRVQRDGYELIDHAPMASFSLAVPVLAGDDVIGALSVLMYRTTVKQDQALEVYLPQMRVAARAIGRTFAASWNTRPATKDGGDSDAAARRDL